MSTDFKYLKVIEVQNLEIVELNVSDCGRVLQLINSVQPHIPWNEDHFHWQYFGRNEHQSKIFGAVFGDDLIGFYAAVNNPVNVGDNTRDVFMVQDVMTAESYRGQGILHLMGETCAEAIDNSGSVGLTFPNEKSANSFRRLGWTEVMGVPLREAKTVQANSGTTLRVSEVVAFDKSVNEIWEESGLRLGVQRDAEYLNWRYSKPGIEYLKFIVGNGAGYLVLKLFLGGNEPKLHLLDLVLKEKDIDSAEEVLNFVFSTANNLGASSITCWLPLGHKYERFFVRSGFSMAGSLSRSVFVRSNGGQDDLLLNEGSWHLSQGDSDVF